MKKFGKLGITSTQIFQKLRKNSTEKILFSKIKKIQSHAKIQLKQMAKIPKNSKKQSKNYVKIQKN